MNETLQPLPPEARTALQHCFAQIRLARATELAQSGRFLEAEAALIHNGELPESAREIDLLARIAARQGSFDEARRRWNAALQMEPGNETYRQCIEHLTPARRVVRLLARAQDTLLYVLVWMAVVFGAAVLIYAFRR